MWTKLRALPKAMDHATGDNSDNTSLKTLEIYLELRGIINHMIIIINIMCSLYNSQLFEFNFVKFSQEFQGQKKCNYS